jgi:hypothetical protein
LVGILNVVVSFYSIVYSVPSVDGEMRYISYAGNDPYFVAAALEVCDQDTVAMINCSVDWIYLGLMSSRAKLINATTVIPIVRCYGRGASYLSEASHCLIFCINTAKQGTQQEALEVLRDTAIARGVTGASIRSNDILYSGKQIGMASPPEQLDNDRFVSVMGFNLYAPNFTKIEANLLFPANKWEDKPDVTNIRDWLIGIRQIVPTATAANIATSIRATIQTKYGIAVTAGSLTTAETAAANALKTSKYTKDSFIRYGEW